MKKYILAILLPWLSFFVRKKVFYGILSLIIPFALFAFLQPYTLMPIYGPLFKIVSYLLGFIPNVWAAYSVYLSEKEKMNNSASELM
jgi:hypothetical protein